MVAADRGAGGGRGRLLELAFRIRAHPHWREHQPTPAARAALHRAAVASPDGGPEVVKKAVDGWLVVVPPGGVGPGHDERG
ncbi:hypothetical protein ACIPW5_36860 [Streptomyces sp. NPDC090077]|uniref:hypothetical protein n=1 Tax=Streptomyces sp. NPDC090077 TaxID=3365938 RepID=UPI00381D6917